MATVDGSTGSGTPSPQSAGDGPSDGRRWDRLHLWQIQAVRDLLVIGAVIGLVYLGYAMRTVTTPLLIALALAYVFEPFVAWSTARLRVGRPIVVGGLLGVLVSVAAVTLILTVPLGVRQTFSLMDDIRSGRLVKSIVNAEQGLPESFREPFRGFLEISGLLEARERAINAARSGGEGDDGTTEDDAAVEPHVNGAAAPRADDGVPRDVSDEPDPAGMTDVDGTPDTATSAAERIDDVLAAVVQGGNDRPLAPAERPEEEWIRLADLDRDDDRPLLAKLFDLEPEDDRIRRIVRDEIASARLAATPPSGPTRWLGFVSRGVSTAWSVLGATIAISLLLFLIPFYFFFFSLWWPTVTGFVGGLIPQRHAPRTAELLGQMDRAVAGFVRGRLVISAIVAVILAVGWYFIGVPYSIVLALAVGVFNLVPYLSGIGLPVAIGLLAMDQLGVPPEYRMGWVWIALAPTVVFVVAQVLDGYILTPMIAGKATDLDPVTIIVAIIAGGTIAGIYGMLIAIPAAACVKIVLREVLLPKVKAWTRGEAADPLPIEE